MRNPGNKKGSKKKRKKRRAQVFIMSTLVIAIYLLLIAEVYLETNRVNIEEITPEESIIYVHSNAKKECFNILEAYLANYTQNLSSKPVLEQSFLEFLPLMAWYLGQKGYITTIKNVTSLHFENSTTIPGTNHTYSLANVSINMHIKSQNVEINDTFEAYVAVHMNVTDYLTPDYEVALWKTYSPNGTIIPITNAIVNMTVNGTPSLATLNGDGTYTLTTTDTPLDSVITTTQEGVGVYWAGT
ncbi:MAG: hypothetical protein Q6362_009785 [Candidatus Wukongarchaeota archaeon]|nr:hypothetical protein [Candidatus Wukongarchaeota archaeon]